MLLLLLLLFLLLLLSLLSTDSDAQINCNFFSFSYTISSYFQYPFNIFQFSSYALYDCVPEMKSGINSSVSLEIGKRRDMYVCLKKYTNSLWKFLRWFSERLFRGGCGWGWGWGI